MTCTDRVKMSVNTQIIKYADKTYCGRRLFYYCAKEYAQKCTIFLACLAYLLL